MNSKALAESAHKLLAAKTLARWSPENIPPTTYVCGQSLTRNFDLSSSRVRSFSLHPSSFSRPSAGNPKVKYSFDPSLGSDPSDPDDRLKTLNESVIFQHYNPKSRRLPRVYVWGGTETGALGAAHFLHPRKPKPRGEFSQRAMKAKRIPRPEPQDTVTLPFRLPHPDFYDLRIASVAAGHGFTLFVNHSRKAKHPKVIGTGLNFSSQLGCVRVTDKKSGAERVIDRLLEPTDVTLPLGQDARVTQAAAGRSHSAVLTDRGEVFTLGNNAQGQCGRTIIENENYRGNSVVHKIEGIDGRVVQVVCGMDHTMFLTEAGAVYSCGWGADGQTGLGHYRTVATPTRVKGDLEGARIKKISCKADCALAVSEEGELFGWGNSEYNQLSVVTPSTQVSVPRRLAFRGLGRIVTAAASASACAVLDVDGRVFVWGFGILGLGPNVESLTEPRMLPEALFGQTPLTPDVRVEDLQPGMSHFAAVVRVPKRKAHHVRGRDDADFGELYAWGANRFGCLGLGHENNQYFPMKVVLPASVKQVACGTNHTVALCDPLLL